MTVSLGALVPEDARNYTKACLLCPAKAEGRKETNRPMLWRIARGANLAGLGARMDNRFDF